MLIGIDASRANKEHKIGTEWYAYYLIRNFAKIDSKNQYILYTDKPLGPGLADLINEENDAEKSDFSIAYDKQGFQIIENLQNFQFIWRAMCSIKLHGFGSLPRHEM